MNSGLGDVVELESALKATDGDLGGAFVLYEKNRGPGTAVSHSVLICSVLYYPASCSVLDRIVLYCAVLLYWYALYCTILYCIVLCCALL